MKKLFAIAFGMLFAATAACGGVEGDEGLIDSSAPLTRTECTHLEGIQYTASWCPSGVSCGLYVYEKNWGPVWKEICIEKDGRVIVPSGGGGTTTDTAAATTQAAD